MKTFITLLFAFICGASYSQEKLVWTTRTCEDGTESAKYDFSQGYYFCTYYGLVAETDPGFSKFYEKYLKEKYRLILLYGGCVSTESKECYSETMRKLIFEKFGADIFLKSLKEAKEIYSAKK
nr:hypothetical protein [uncultured Flavobacterium sp.]